MRTTPGAPLLAASSALLLAACGGPEPVGGSGSLVHGMEGRGPLVLLVSGTPYEMGWHHGRVMREEIRRIVSRPVEGEAAGMYPAYAAGMRPLLPPEAERELHGIAAGAGVTADDLFLREVAREARRWHDPQAARLSGSVLAVGGEGASVVATWTPTARAALPSLLVVARKPTGGTPTLVLAWPGALGAAAGLSGRGVVAVQAEDGNVAPEQRTLRGVPFAIGFRLALERAAGAAAFGADLKGLVGNLVAVADARGAAFQGLVRFGGSPLEPPGIVTRPENLFAAPGDTYVRVAKGELRVGDVTYRLPD